MNYDTICGKYYILVAASEADGRLGFVRFTKKFFTYLTTSYILLKIICTRTNNREEEVMPMKILNKF